MNSTIPKFTFAIPVYNGEPFIADTLDSLLNQSYPYFNIVVLENGSTDKTVEIVEIYQDERILLISSRELLSIEKNWKRILDIQNPNEFLVLMCADDILYPQFLEKIAQAIQDEPKATLYHTRAIFIDENDQFIGNCASANYKETAEEFLDAVHQFQQDVFGTGYVMRFSDFKAVGGYPQYIKLLFADIYCYFELTRKSYKVCVQEHLVGFRRHSASTGYNAHTNDFILAAEQYQTALLRDANDIDVQLMQDFIRQFILVQYRRYLIDMIKQKQRLEKPTLQAHKQKILSGIVDKKAFAYDFSVSWYAYLAEIPIWSIRISLMYLLIIGMKVRKYLLTIRQNSS